MAKIISYKFLSCEVQRSRQPIMEQILDGIDETPSIEQIFLDKTVSWSEANEEIAKAEAYNGEYTIEDDGVEVVSEPTQLDRVEAQLAYTAIMTDTLLEV